jgi:single-stranded DNA-binding protein
MDCNIVVLVGRLAAEPEHRVFDGGMSLIRLLVATATMKPRRRVDVIPVTLWDPPSDLLGAGLDRGRRVFVVGTVQRRFWSAEGRRSRIEVVAHDVQLGSRSLPSTAA